ncbi:MAG TPA: hypothetical protein PKY82_17530 [Pyrinomonadaceae bacterium]|nr:hypothetical protein [Pyrinomonadaceae bacterium]
MALSKETAGKIIQAVAIDQDCQNAISPNPILQKMAPVLNPTTDFLLKFTHLAGAVRNIPLVAKNILQGKTPQEDPEMTARLCLGILAETVEAIHTALRQKKIPEVHTASGISRTHWGTHHAATCIRMEDDSEYVFDWHATLKINDPVISKPDDWVNAKIGINYVLFQGFK